MRAFLVSQNEAGQRLDKLLAKYLDKAPKSFLYKMLRKKNILLNGKKAEGSEKVALNDEIKLFLSEETITGFSTKQQILYDENKKGTGRTSAGKQQGYIRSKWVPRIVYEDEHILIVDKPAGELSQKADKDDVSMNEKIVAYLAQTYGIGSDSFTPGVCNRLDRNTSGLLVAGKSLAGLQQMADLFRKKSVQKYYLCIVCGEAEGTRHLRGYIKKDGEENKVQILEALPPQNAVQADDLSQPKERYAIVETEYASLCTANGYSLLAVQLITGKTHQIRAHLASIGLLPLGDIKYGNAEKNRVAKEELRVTHQLLHAFMLCFPKTEGALLGLSEKTITTPPPRQFAQAADQLFGKEKWEHAVMEFERLKRLGVRGAAQPDK